MNLTVMKMIQASLLGTMDVMESGNGLKCWEWEDTDLKDLYLAMCHFSLGLSKKIEEEEHAD